MKTKITIAMFSLTILILFLVSKPNFYFSIIISIYSLFFLPYIGRSSNEYNNLKAHLAVVIIVIYMMLLSPLVTYLTAFIDDPMIINNQFIAMESLTDTIVFFIILIMTLIFISLKKYTYTHYYFIILIVVEFIQSIGRGEAGHIFSFINIGVIFSTFTIIYYSIYILNIKYFQIKNYISVCLATSFGLLGVNLILWDMKENSTYLKMIGIDDNVVVVLLCFSLLLFMYGLYMLFLEMKQSEIR